MAGPPQRHTRHGGVNYDMQISSQTAYQHPMVHQAAAHHGVSVHDLAKIVSGGATIAEALLTLAIIL